MKSYPYGNRPQDGIKFSDRPKICIYGGLGDHHLPDVNPNNYPILKDVIPIIDRWLEDDIRQPRKNGAIQ